MARAIRFERADQADPFHPAAYNKCTGPDLWKSCQINNPKVPFQNPTKDDPFGTKVKDPPPANQSNPQVDLAISTAKDCLRKHPLAALDGRFNDIEPAEPYK